MQRVLTRYIFREMAVPFVLCLAILTFTALLSKALKLVDLMVTHGIGFGYVVWFVVSVIPSFLIYTIPISFLVAVLVAFTRLSTDSEITAIKSSGISLLSITKPVFVLAFIAYILTTLSTLYLFPWGNLGLKRLLFEVARTKATAGIDEKTFYDHFKDIVLYVDHIDPKSGELEGIFIAEEKDGKSNIVLARKGVLVPSRERLSIYLTLYDGAIHREGEAEEDYHLASFSTYNLRLELKGTNSAPSDRTNRELYPSELLLRIKDVVAKGNNPAPFIIDFHKRFALPASVFVFALLGVPLGLQRVRTARFTGFTIALAVVLIYYILSTALEGLGENGAIDPVVSVWGSDIIMAIAGIYIFHRTSRDKPLTPFSLFAGKEGSGPGGNYVASEQ